MHISIDSHTPTHTHARAEPRAELLIKFRLKKVELDGQVSIAAGELRIFIFTKFTISQASPIFPLCLIN
jgi:hypothetical protein